MPSASKISRTLEMTPLPDWFVPGPRHVICAKGKQAKEHAANQLLKSLIHQHLEEYKRCPSKLERSFIVSKILKCIRNGGEGGFVRKLNGRWSDIGDRNAREKIGQSFRDSLGHIFKSSTRAKACFRQRRSSDSDIHPAPIVPFFAMSDNVRYRHSVSLDGTDAFTPSILAQDDTELELTDLEPLPLSKGIAVDLNEMSQVSSEPPEDASFREAMEEMFQCHFSGSSTRSAHSV
ncbi:Nitrilase family, member 2 [Seminavis robusta]|uniref:Nitrilase family, member 2 n=1 Tax=Seminavis robusta TaxID=568900 RepID=A0A9N8DIC6_9STRA|nr:Nitrilase family, member 2 [Seminavis robusta]|eukprot:Sro158_g071670.1 Nitrilase family, member 2 (234) ;mRNA; f:84815-85516